MGAVQFDWKHLPRNRKVEGSNPTSGPITAAQSRVPPGPGTVPPWFLAIAASISRPALGDLRRPRSPSCRGTVDGDGVPHRCSALVRLPCVLLRRQPTEDAQLIARLPQYGLQLKKATFLGRRIDCATEFRTHGRVDLTHDLG
jgi:hypothetical protein